MIPKIFHYHICPPLFIVVFTLAAQILAVYAGNEKATWSWIGTDYSWRIVSFMTLWALLSLWVPGKIYKGPPTSFGVVPKYKANGFQFFVISVASYSILLLFRPQTAIEITDNFPQIIASCSIFAFVLCAYLWIQGKFFPQSEEKLLESFPLPYEFYRGMEIHPRMLGIDVKQFTNCRFGLMAWQWLNMTFFYYGWVTRGFNLAFFVGVVLQTVYLGKFYWWETGYFNTLDITLDRAGYYICWGCLVWVPSFFPFVLYLLASRPCLVSNSGAILILLFGLVSIALNYRVDWEKEYFRSVKGKCSFYNKPVTYIKAYYKTKTGMKQSLLLTSGCWGFARHLNYVFEVCVAVSWSLPALGYSIWPFMYPIFIAVLAVHRVFRDEEKCQTKYGQYWNEYCLKVPYRFIPYVF